MSGLKDTIIRGGLESLFFSGAHLALKPFVGGVGAILTMHHVRPPHPDRFQPNRILEITPRFLTRVVKLLRRSAVNVISLDEMYRRMTERDFRRRFVCLTFDDAYRDIQQYAYPILKAAQMPFAIYVPTSFPDRLGELWWLALEAVIARNDRIGLVIDGKNRTFDCGSVADKRTLYDELYWWLRRRPTRPQCATIVRDLAACYAVDIAAFCRDLCMDWQRAHAARRRSAGDHRRPHRQSPDAGEAAGKGSARGNGFEPFGDRGRDRLAAATSVLSVRGCRLARVRASSRIAAELGFKTAVTTRPGVIFRTHSAHLTALPRISINGEYQQLRYVRVLLSGAATAMWNGFRRAA